MENFYTAFQPNINLVSKRSFENKNDLIVNNLNHNILNQDVYDTILQIDSSDRNTKIYPNPFDIKVTFDPSAKTYDRNNNNVFEGTPKPHIPIDFQNVKFIKLASIILPRHYCLNKKYNNNSDDCNITNKISWEYDENKTLDNNRILFIQIKEINNNTYLGTNNTINKSFATMCIFKPIDIAGTYFTCSLYGGAKLFKSSELGNLKSLSIKITDEFGNTIQPVGMDLSCDTPNYCICNNHKYTSEQKEKCVCKYIRHPLNPKFQILMCFRIGFIENELSVSYLKN